MKFIHTSDWHIGRQFHNVSLLEDQAFVLRQLVAYIHQESVDALIIAGDIYDRAVPPASAVDMLDSFLTYLCDELKLPVIIIPGNHDSAQRLRFGSRQLKQAGLHILGKLESIREPVIIQGQSGRIAFYGIPYCDPETVRNAFSNDVSTYDEAHTYLVNLIGESMSQETPNVLISHCFMYGAEESESERPLSIGGSDRVSYAPCSQFDYVALGHLHSPQYTGEKHIRYSGSLLKYSFSEQHQKKGVNLVEMDSEGLVSVTPLPLTPRYDMRVIEGDLESIIEKGKVDPGADDYLLVRLTDRHAILDPMAKLRTVYPNVLQLEKPGMLVSGESVMNREKLKYKELEMFKDFFKQVYGDDLSPDQEKCVSETINSLIRAEATE